MQRPSAGAPDAALSARLYGMNSADAAQLLLGTQFSEVDQSWHTLDASCSASFAPVTELGVPCAVPAAAASVFASHLRLPLPDNPPGVGTVSGVHRFTLDAELAASLNESLHDAAVRRRHEGQGVGISNVNGFHTEEELFHPEGTQPAGTVEGGPALWYARLQDILVEALRLAHQCADDGTSAASPDAADMLISGWLNVSGRGAFNTLHEHGECAVSAVYFVDDGQCQAEGGDEGGCGDHCGAGSGAQGGAQGGDLLLRTQLRAFTHEYGFLAVAPLPGTLVLFPGYMPHAVLPRRQATDEAAMDGAASLRISVACNMQCAEQRRGHLCWEERHFAEEQRMQLGRACRLVRILKG